MIAFGSGELLGLVNGLAVGSSFIQLLSYFKYLIFAVVLLYGIYYWTDQMTSNDQMRSVLDFVKPTLWFFYTVIIAYLFFNISTGKIQFFNAFIDSKEITKGIQITEVGKGGVKLIDAEKPTLNVYYKAPSLFGILEFPDALEFLFISQVLGAVDSIGYNAYEANVFTPDKVFSYCFRKSLLESPTAESKNVLCKLLIAYKNERGEGGFFGFVKNGLEALKCDISNARFDLYHSPVFDKYETCIDRYYDSYVKHLNRLKSDGKLSKEEYSRNVAVASKVAEDLKNNFEDYAVSLITLYGDRYGGIKAVESLANPSVNKDESLVQSLIGAFGEFWSNVFAGKSLVMKIYETSLAFTLALEVGIAFPLLMLLSCFPNGRTIVGLKHILLAVGSYFILKFSRVLIILLYLIAYNRYLQGLYH